MASTDEKSSHIENETNELKEKLDTSATGHTNTAAVNHDTNQINQEDNSKDATAQDHDNQGSVGEENTSAKDDSADTKQETGAESSEPGLGIDLAQLLGRHFGIRGNPEQVLSTVTIEGVMEYILAGKCHNIVTMAGAGISTSAGIPDFRSPNTGLYANLQKYNLPSPTAIFSIDYFMENPKPFFALAKQLWPGTFQPTPCHFFIKLLQDKGLLLRHYTQNIDTLERVVGVDPDKIVEAHGTFHTSHCLRCQKEYSQDWIKEKIFSAVDDEVPRCEECDAVVKPDIVFFGESLPERFGKLVTEDLRKCDLLIVMGTSLTVQPFASITSRVQVTCPRLYINREKTGSGDPFMALLMGGGGGFEFDNEDNYRDVFFQGDCDDGCLNMADKLGWTAELKKVMTDFAKKTAPKPHHKSPTKSRDIPPTTPHRNAAPTSSVNSSKKTPSPLKPKVSETSSSTVSATASASPKSASKAQSKSSPMKSLFRRKSSQDNSKSSTSENSKSSPSAKNRSDSKNSQPKGGKL